MPQETPDSQDRGFVGTTLSDHGGKIDNLETNTVSQAELDAATSALSVQIATANGVIQGLAAQIISLSTIIASLQADITGLQGSVTALTSAHNSHVTSSNIHCPCP